MIVLSFDDNEPVSFSVSNNLLDISTACYHFDLIRAAAASSAQKCCLYVAPIQVCLLKKYVVA